MESLYCSRLLMLGAAPETRGSIAAVVDAYRAHGLFRRWPIEYIATHGDGTRLERIAFAFKALRRFGELLARERRVAVHLHTAARGNFWRDLPYMLATIAAGRPLIVQLHGAGFERFYDACDIVLSPSTAHVWRTWTSCVYWIAGPIETNGLQLSSLAGSRCSSTANGKAMWRRL